MDTLFFELIQVSLGLRDCLERGAEPEEWQQLYDMSRQHGIASLCYKGVEKLFEYGLRAPQDISIDWMAEAEEAEDTVKTVTLDGVYRQFLSHQLTMRTVIDYYFTITRRRQPQKPYGAISMGLLGWMGERRFLHGLMWVLQQALLLPDEKLLATPWENEGRFILDEMLREHSRLRMLKHYQRI